jgi:hypothetical protein
MVAFDFEECPILTRQFGGNGGKSIDTGNGGRSPGGGARCGLTAGEAAVAGGLKCGKVGNPDRPAPGGGAVVVVRPSEAATVVDPMPGTVGSIMLARLTDGPRGIAPEVKLTSAVGVRPAVAAAPAGAGAGPACERTGCRPAGE